MSYSIWWVEFVGADRTHKAIFLENADDGGGVLHSVEGNILNGMIYRSKPFRRPEDSASFVSKEKLGTISYTNIPKIEQTCRSFPPPGVQMNLKGQKINPSSPLYRCTEWTSNVKNALMTNGTITWDTRIDDKSQKYCHHKISTKQTTWISEYRREGGTLAYWNQYDNTTSLQKPEGLYRPVDE
ncbi:MAG: hypothetical protein M1814_002326 [Vezdaea aestivalis]|nr:MAG: hypothetical protein M1814_002326 [Vezdaea aestivalis]